MKVEENEFLKTVSQHLKTENQLNLMEFNIFMNG